jgi:hypothetical protein
MKLHQVYKSLLNEVRLDDMIPPWYNPAHPLYRPQYNPTNPMGPAPRPINPKPSFDIHNIQPNPIAPDRYVLPTQDKQVPQEVIDRYIQSWKNYVEGNGRPNKPPVPPGFSLLQWLMYLWYLGIISSPWWFATPTGGNPAGYPPGTSPDNWTGDYPPPVYPPIYTNQPIDLY